MTKGLQLDTRLCKHSLPMNTVEKEHSIIHFVRFPVFTIFSFITNKASQKITSEWDKYN